jgi:hypothetical protein
MTDKNFYKKFIFPEFKHIAGGSSFKNLLILIVILFFSLLAIGISQWAISFLGEKMNSPFVSIVELKNPYNRTPLSKIVSTSKNNFYEVFGIDSSKTIETTIDYRKFYRLDKEVGANTKVRRGVDNDPFLAFLEKEDFFKTSNHFINKWGCIVTEDYLVDKLQFEFESKDGKKVKKVVYPKYLSLMRNIDGVRCYFQVPISGVVKQLPHGLDLIAGEKLFDSFDDNDFYREIIKNNKQVDYFNLYIKNPTTEILDKLNGFTKVKVKNSEIFDRLSQVIRKDIIDSLEHKRIQDLVNERSDIFRVYDFDRYSLNTSEVQSDYINFTFQKDRLSSIRELQKYLKEEFTNLDIDLSIVEAKENFSLFNKIANFLRYVLVFYSIFSIVIYIISIVLAHITKSEKSLGTLKAFGLSNNSIILCYSIISISMIIIAFFVGYVFSHIIGTYLISNVGSIMNVTASNHIEYHSINIGFLILAYIVLPSFIIFLRLRSRLVGITPGDLIYGRN